MMMTMMNVVIDNDDDEVKRHWNSDDVQMTIWPLPLLTPPLDAISALVANDF